MTVFAILPVYATNTKRWRWMTLVNLCFDDEESEEEWLYGPNRWYEEIIDE